MNVLRKEVLIRQVSFKSHRRHFHVVLVSRKYTLNVLSLFFFFLYCYILYLCHLSHPFIFCNLQVSGIFSLFRRNHRTNNDKEKKSLGNEAIIAFFYRKCRGPAFLTMPTNSALLPNSAARSPDRHKTRANYRPATCLLGGEWVKR